MFDKKYYQKKKNVSFACALVLLLEMTKKKLFCRGFQRIDAQGDRRIFVKGAKDRLCLSHAVRIAPHPAQPWRQSGVTVSS